MERPSLYWERAQSPIYKSQKEPQERRSFRPSLKPEIRPMFRYHIYWNVNISYIKCNVGRVDRYDNNNFRIVSLLPGTLIWFSIRISRNRKCSALVASYFKTNLDSGDFHRLAAPALGLALQWCHNERDGVSDHRRLGGLFSCLFKRRSKETSKPRVTGLCKGNSPVTGEFPSQRASNAENVFMWCRHHGLWTSNSNSPTPSCAITYPCHDLNTRLAKPTLLWENYVMLSTHQCHSLQ